MKIVEEKRKELLFPQLAVGDVFSAYKSGDTFKAIYLKIGLVRCLTQEYNAIRLDTAEFAFFTPFDCVELVDCELVIK